jgi:putative ABC transport system permease protein
MKYLPLLFASLFRRKTRTLLTVLSILTAFVLFGLLTAVDVLFNSTAESEAGSTRLVVQSRTSFTQSLPLRMAAELEAIPGVVDVTWQQWFGAQYQSPRNQIFGFAVPPDRWKRMYPEWVLPPEQAQAFIDTRASMVAGRGLADRFGWSVGDRVPIQSNIFPQRDGNKTWEFELVGIFDGIDDSFQAQTANTLYINFDYFREANQFGQGFAGMYMVRAASQDQMEAVAAAIDARYLNSDNETKTQTEQAFQLSFARQIGDIGLIVRSILAAVMFTILLLTANTMAQSVRERIPELAVLKTLGFSDTTVLLLVLAEAFALVALGGLTGMGIAALLGPGLTAGFGFPPLALGAGIWLQGLLAMAAMALVVGLLPALRARRLSIIDALAGR